MYLPGFESAPDIGRTAPILIVSGMFAAGAAEPVVVVPPVPPPPHAATTKAATSATAESFRMCLILPRCSGTRELCASVRLSLWTFAPVKSAVRPKPPDSRPTTVGADHPELGAPGEQPAEGAGRSQRHSDRWREWPHGRGPHGREAEQGAAIARDVGLVAEAERGAIRHLRCRDRSPDAAPEEDGPVVADGDRVVDGPRGDRPQGRGHAARDRPPAGVLESVRDASGPDGPRRERTERDHRVEVVADPVRVDPTAAAALTLHRPRAPDREDAITERRHAEEVVQLHRIGADRLLAIVDRDDPTASADGEGPIADAGRGDERARGRVDELPVIVGESTDPAA